MKKLHEYLLQKKLKKQNLFYTNQTLALLLDKSISHYRKKMSMQKLR